jgi:hypothetical protein
MRKFGCIAAAFAGQYRARMRGGFFLGSWFVLASVVACGGSESPALTATSAPAASHPDEEEPPVPVSHEASPAETEQPVAASSQKPEVATPEFKPNGSVAEAISAVPQGTPRLNIEQEALGRPLGNVELYESCKPGNAHFKAKVAVWDGKAVGLDLTTTPKNQKFGDCIAEKIRAITWPDKVKALNVVEYTF